MNSINMKIHTYDADQNIIVVSFSSDRSQKPVEEYTKFAFNLREMGVNTIDALLKKIASMGVEIAETSDSLEVAPQVAFGLTELQSLEGQVFSYNLNELPNMPTNVDDGNVTVS